MKIKLKPSKKQYKSAMKVKDTFDFFADKVAKDNKKSIKKGNGIRTLVIYDITDNKKRREIVKYLSGYGVRVQRSAFEMLLDKKKTKELKKGLKSFKGDKDKVYIYQFGKFTDIIRYGFDPKEKYEEDDFII